LHFFNFPSFAPVPFHFYQILFFYKVSVFEVPEKAY